MSTPTHFRVFLSAASSELAAYREEVARVLRRKNIEVREQQHFRQGGKTLLDTLNNYIDECDAVICLIGDHCGSLPSDEHMAAMLGNEWVGRFRTASGQPSVSYTQWEFLLAKSQDKLTYVYLTAKGFIPDDKREKAADESAVQKSLQAAYRSWIQHIGEHWAPLTTANQLIEDVLVLPFPDLTMGKPNNLPNTSLGTLFKGREQFLTDLHQTLNHSTRRATAITDKDSPNRAKAVHGSGGIGKTRGALEYAWRYEQEYSALLFLTAESPEMLNTNLAGLADVLPMNALATATDDQLCHRA